ncbi:hypothetical protein PPERSA_08558 [Pseudocohnilembus persalinus]|uniref:VWFA domain-containing protein n=1 Tax=Pseudocohnilembus persalinus TaxID=266149 RepID=A0A0V0R6R4_PSEPJ|nr:hypothetical protein PPERSA_08558 [Pseudocohnilembus persalinus]|eukprot:KRX10155.1 hypothetical protein PPERSA_08558 [Pseudocohnilembus persalinus]
MFEYFQHLKLRRGGTTLTAGLTAGIKQLEDLIKNEQKNAQKNTQKRVLFLTDMLSLDAIELQQLIESGIKQQIYFSIIGIGVDFDNQITDIISKYEGCNYFSLTKDEEVQETLVESFDYNFFPFAYNVDLMMQNSNYEVQEVYGIPFQTTQNKDLGDNYKQFTALILLKRSCFRFRYFAK